MLKQLSDYALKKMLVAEPGFAPKTARWEIAFAEEGRFVGVVELGDASNRKNSGKEFAICPELSQPDMVRLATRFGEKGAAHFLLDTCEVCVLYSKENETDENRTRAEGKHRVFLRLLQEASGSLPVLVTLVRALEDPETQQRIHERLRELKAKPTDKMTFRMGDDTLIEKEDWHDWWRGFRRGDTAAEKGQSVKQLSFLSAQPISPAMTHPKFNLSDVGGMSAGSTLISFDKSAFESYGLTQSANAAMSEEEAKSYHAALTYLLARQSKNLAGMKIAYWFDREIPDENDPLAWLFATATAEQWEASGLRKARELLAYLRSGERAATDLGRSRYFALTVSGAAGRVMVRDWMEGAFEDLATHVAQWFADLEITNARGSKSAKEPSMERVLTCLLPPKPAATKYEDWIKPLGSLRLPLWNSALRGEPIPFAILPRILREHTSFVLKGEMAKLREADGDSGLRVATLQARMALLRAYHVRKGKYEMKSALDTEHPEPAYHCGRLMAVFEDLQREAFRRENRKVDAGVIERYYAACASTPNLVLSRLFKLSNFHLNKFDGQRVQGSNGMRRIYQEYLREIMNQIKDQLPRTLDLEKQSLFALGYYHQMAQIAIDTAQRIENATRKKLAHAPANGGNDTLDFDETDVEVEGE